MNAQKSTIDEIEGALERELLAFDALKSRVEALRDEADDLWASRGPRLATIDALQKVFQLMSGGQVHPSAVVPVDMPDDDPARDDGTPPQGWGTAGHTTVIDVGAVAQQIVPASAFTVVAQALQQCGRPIHVKELITIINHPHYRMPQSSATKYLSDLYQAGLAERPSPGVYVWVTPKEPTV